MVVLILLLVLLWGGLCDMRLYKLSANRGGSVVFQVGALVKGEDIMSVFWSHTRGEKPRLVAICKPDTSSNKIPTITARASCRRMEPGLELRQLTEEDIGVYEATIYSSRDPLHVFFYLQLNGVNTHEVHEKLSAARGDSVLFRDKVSGSTGAGCIFWSRNRTGDVQLFAISKADNLKELSDKFTGRLRSQHPGMSLNLSGLMDGDSGTYEALVLTGQEPIFMYFHLQVVSKDKEPVNSQSHGVQWTCRYIILTISLGTFVSFVTNES